MKTGWQLVWEAALRRPPQELVEEEHRCRSRVWQPSHTRTGLG